MILLQASQTKKERGSFSLVSSAKDSAPHTVPAQESVVHRIQESGREAWGHFIARAWVGQEALIREGLALDHTARTWISGSWAWILPAGAPRNHSRGSRGRWRGRLRKGLHVSAVGKLGEEVRKGLVGE